MPINALTLCGHFYTSSELDFVALSHQVGWPATTKMNKEITESEKNNSKFQYEDETNRRGQSIKHRCQSDWEVNLFSSAGYPT